MQEKNLMDYFQFDESDLNLNRHGSLAERQKTRLTAELKSARTKKTRWAYFIFFLAAIGLVVGLGIWFVPAAGLGLRIGFTIGFGIVWTTIYGVIGLIFLPPAAYTDLELANETGRVNIVKVQSHNSNTHTTDTRYDLYIGNRRFVVDSRIGNVLIQGDEYTVYYLKNSSKIVSAEFVSKAK
jgi:hypothetical protein